MSSNKPQDTLDNISPYTAPGFRQLLSGMMHTMPIVFTSMQTSMKCKFHSSPYHIDVEALLWLPEWRVYWKDLEGCFLGCNDKVAMSTSLPSRHALIGKTDYDLPVSKEDVVKARLNDERVIIERKALEFRETAIYNKIKTVYLTMKTPLYNHDGKMVGVLGLSRVLQQEQWEGDDQLTDRQEECLTYLVCGYSAKQISQLMNLAPKTIQNHLDNIKAKLGCGRRSELIVKALRLSGVKDRLLKI
jgi:DNA-binding CsgD family transcriptional regulator